jgi:hypothetical protein
MSVYKATSWGRTRSPKNLAGPPGTEVVCLANTNDLRLSNTGYKTVGYATENQRYLHLLLEDATTSDDPGAVTVFGYCHAFERWFELPASFTPQGGNSGPTAISLDLANESSRDENAKVPSDREYRTYEILGIDRVAFVSATAASQINVWAACSTF